MIERFIIGLMFAIPAWFVFVYIIFKIKQSYLPEMVPNKMSKNKGERTKGS